MHNASVGVRSTFVSAGVHNVPVAMQVRLSDKVLIEHWRLPYNRDAADAGLFTRNLFATSRASLACRACPACPLRHLHTSCA